MSKPIKKTKQTPGGYSPKGKPEILTMTTEAMQAQKIPAPAAQPAIITRGPMFITGIAGDGYETLRTWQDFERRYGETPFPKADEYSYEIRFYGGDTEPAAGQDIHVGYLSDEAVAAEGFATVAIPATQYAVWEVVVAEGYDSQNKNMDQWLATHEGVYRQVMVDGLNFAIECYTPKFEQGVVEIWVPFEPIDPAAPGDYAPKTRPEIINMMEQAVEQHVEEFAVGENQRARVIRKRFLMAGFEIAVDFDRGFEDELAWVRGELERSLERIGNKTQPMRLIGFWQPWQAFATPHNPESEAKAKYFFGVEVSSLDDLSSDFVVKAVPMSEYAVCREERRGTAPKADMSALPGYEPHLEIAGDFEIFDDFDPCGEQDSCDILVPIKPKG